MLENCDVVSFTKNLLAEWDCQVGEQFFEERINLLLKCGNGDLNLGLEKEIFAIDDKQNSSIFFLRDLIKAGEYELAFLILMTNNMLSRFEQKCNFFEAQIDKKAFVYMMD